MKTYAISMMAVSLTACMTVGEDGVFRDDDGADVVVHTETIGAELAQSPVHEAEVFTKLTYMIDQQAAGPSVQVATSPDGSTWSDWQVINAAAGTAVGEVPVATGSKFFRLRGDASNASYLHMVAANDAVEAADGTEEWSPDAEEEGDDSTFGLQIMPRSAWGAAKVRSGCSGFGQAATKVTVHHTDTPNNDINPERRIRSIQAGHQGKGWCDVGYHYLISADGRVWQGREMRYRGAHAGSVKRGGQTVNLNNGNIGVALLGSFTSAQPSTAQRDSLSKLLAHLEGQHKALNLSRTTVRGHTELKSTTCPGTVEGKLDAVVTKANTL